MILFLSNFCFANDTAWVDHAGQIQFVQEPDVSIQKEVLEFISGKDPYETFVRVTYLMKNESDKGKEVEIAFPLPLLDVIGCTYPYSGPNCDNPKMKLFVDDKDVNGSWDVRMESADQKYTTRMSFRDLPGPEDYYFCDGHKAHTKENKKFCTKVFKKNCNILKKETKKNKCQEAIGSLKLNRIFKWKYQFPKDKLIKVVHEYRPRRGGFSSKIGKDLPIYPENQGTVTGIKDSKDPFCIKEGDSNLQSSIGEYYPSWTTYILRTGANWKGPINHFELIIRKKEDETVSTCFPGLKKINDTEFKSVLKNFNPTADILVGYFFKKLPN